MPTFLGSLRKITGDVSVAKQLLEPTLSLQTIVIEQAGLSLKTRPRFGGVFFVRFWPKGAVQAI